MRYSIPVWNIESLEKKITKIRNKCAKYGCEFKYERVGEHFEEVTFSYMDEYTGSTKRCKQVVKFIDVEAEGTAAVNGWRFAASLEYTKKGNIIKAVPGMEIPKRFYECGPWCEHCKTNRDRKYSYVVFEEETGEFKQVGKSCLKDFTGGLSAEAVANFESYFKECESFSGFGSGLGSGKQYYETNAFLKCAAETIRVFGYVRNGDSGISTASRSEEIFRVENGYRIGGGRQNEEIVRDRYEEAKSRGFDSDNAESAELAEKVREWIVTNERDDNYFHNLKVALSLEYIGWDKIGLIVSAFPAYNKNLEIEAERRERERKAREEGELSKYVGEVGKRVSFKPADYKVLTSWETMYGTTTLYKIVDEAGNVFIWKASAWINAGRPVEKITGTVKEHSEYGGVKQTVLTRCKVEYGKEKHEEWNDENDRAIDAFLKYCDGEEDWEKCCAS